MAGARLELATRPPGVDAWAGDRYLGRTPLSAEIAAGTTLLRLAEVSDSVLWTAPAIDTLLHAEEGETLRLELQLGRTFRISSRPVGFPILQGGRRIGETPLDLRLNRDEIGSLRPPDSGWHDSRPGRVAVGARPLVVGRRSRDPKGGAGKERLLAAEDRKVCHAGRRVRSRGGGATAERAADRSYRRYLSTADPSRIEKYYDEARRRDALSTALWAGAEVSLATMIIAWIFPEEPGERGGR